MEMMTKNDLNKMRKDIREEINNTDIIELEIYEYKEKFMNLLFEKKISHKQYKYSINAIKKYIAHLIDDDLFSEHENYLDSSDIERIENGQQEEKRSIRIGYY